MGLERITTKEAAEVLNMSVLTVQHLMRQNRLPIGIAVKREGRGKYHYIIYKDLFDSCKEKIEKGELVLFQV